MRLKRMLALCCAALYITATGAAAAEPVPGETSLSGQTVAAEYAAPQEQPAGVETVPADETAQPAAAQAGTAAETAPVTDTPVVRATALTVAVSTHKVQVNGQPVQPQAYLIDGYNYYKLRDIAYMLRGTSSAFDVTWDADNNAVNIVSGTAYTAVGGEMTVASVAPTRVQQSTAKLLLDGSGISIKGYMINGNNYYKIADVASAIGFGVAFESTTRTVQITTAAASPDPETPETNFVTGVYRVTVDTTLSLRSGPGLSYPVVGQLSNGDEIIVDSLTSGWAHIKNIGRYCSVDYLTRVRDYTSESAGSGTDDTSSQQPDETFTKGVYRVKVDTTLSVRSGPGLSYPVIGRLSNGDEIIVDSLSNDWAHIWDADGSASQYCSADYLTRVRDYTGDTEPEEPEEPFSPGVYQVKVDTTLSVRSGPGTSYSIIGLLSDGDQVVIDEMENGWAHLMDTESGTGRYCSADYLTRVRDYDSSEGTPEDPVEPPRTSHLDGVMTVIVDAGHGGSDVGAHNADMSLDEKHVNLYVAQYLKDYLEDAGVRVIMVRDTLEEGSSLTLRGQVMEQYASSADLFFSIHHNAANTTARGAEALAQIADKNGGPSKLLAEALLEEYEKLGVPIRSVVFKEGSNGDYYYTNRAAAALFIPALTSEFCFIDNEEDQKFIDSDADLQAEARAQYNAIMYYFSQVEY